MMANVALVQKKEVKPLQIMFALMMVYIFWGGTYLGIKIAIESLPPFFVAGIRSLIAGSILFVWARLKGAASPGFKQWRAAGIVGALLLLVGNGLVTWAQRMIPSGIASLLVATVPLWITVLSALSKHGKKPNMGTVMGVMLGLVGIGVLVLNPSDLSGTSGMNLIGVVALLIAAFSWSVGSLYSRRAELPDSPLLSTAMQMLVGGSLLLIVSFVQGSWAEIDIVKISVRSYLALGYLIVFGSLVAYNAYIWLLKYAEPTLVSTYAFVNPIVAVFLGWVFAGERLTFDSMLAAVIIITAVVIITIYRDRKPKTSGV